MRLWAGSAEYLICRMYARACCTWNRTVRTDKMILKDPVLPFTHRSSLSSKLIIVIVSFMINLVISFPITSIQGINQRGWRDRPTWSQWFQDSQVSLHLPLLLLVHARSNPVRWFTCWMCGSKADWYGEGETGRLWTWKLASCLFSPSCGAAWHGRLSQKIY